MPGVGGGAGGADWAGRARRASVVVAKPSMGSRPWASHEHATRVIGEAGGWAREHLAGHGDDGEDVLASGFFECAGAATEGAVKAGELDEE